MNLSPSTLTAWLAIVASSNAFTTTQIGSSSHRASSQRSMLLQPEKFDKIVTTNRNKDLGYNDQTGRFFEIQSTSTDTEESTTALMSEEIVAHGDANNAVEAAADTVAEEELNTVEDIPPMPEDGFVGMNVTGEINGVKMTSSKETIKRKRIEEEYNDDELSAAEEMDFDVESKSNSLTDRISSSGAVSAAAVATAAVNAAVSMKSLTASSTDKSYIALDTS
eukprot:scaffold41841_cov144-Skeletonema_dohrnii-CCMP3373.AAC.1